MGASAILMDRPRRASPWTRHRNKNSRHPCCMTRRGARGGMVIVVDDEEREGKAKANESKSRANQIQVQDEPTTQPTRNSNKQDGTERGWVQLRERTGGESRPPRRQRLRCCIDAGIHRTIQHHHHRQSNGSTPRARARAGTATATSTPTPHGRTAGPERLFLQASRLHHRPNDEPRVFTHARRTDPQCPLAPDRRNRRSTTTEQPCSCQEWPTGSPTPTTECRSPTEEHGGQSGARAGQGGL